MGAPHYSTGPGCAVLPVEGVDTHLMVGWTRLRGTILRRVAEVAVHRTTVHTDRCTGRGCMWNEHMGAPHDCTGPGGAILPVEGVDTHLTVGWIRQKHQKNFAGLRPAPRRGSAQDPPPDARGGV
jgi:hypothetical protein